MMNKKLISVSGRILVNKEVDNVFDFFANPGNDKLWRAEINNSILDGPLQPGVIISEYSNLSKKASNNLLKLQCVQFEKNNNAVFETTGSERFYLKSQRMVRTVSKSSTELTYKLEFDKSIVKFATGFSLPGFLISFKAGSDLKKYLRKLKTRIEST
ncbi:hypothetical protein LZZ85_10570 [Terrimonas sp. NA20]|uniref:SRPBCC family protein n=1 Tax=Terrimonas ginsenosidimutans TaxID=2908004 RepID=A0ABS9KQZ3_9BACT|nr:hypothetical protein [Terrimonas ginsenosidimutans]MCG2614728.1 hypothetical protein [Terrimonas ginsenosidimutans]